METRRRVEHAAVLLALLVVLCIWGAASAAPGPTTTRLLYATGKIVPLPASIPHEEGDMVDRRIIPDLRWIAERYPIFVTDGYSGPLPSGEHAGCDNCHTRGSDHYNGLAVDLVPQEATARCDGRWGPITRLAQWAEPQQGMPIPPFRWVGYDGDAGHGCGNHLHLSWNHSPAPQFQLAEWVEVFPLTAGKVSEPPRGKKSPPAPPAPPLPPPGSPTGGISQSQTGGLSPRGYAIESRRFRD